jgi:predicted transcriptional regulator
MRKISSLSSSNVVPFYTDFLDTATEQPITTGVKPSLNALVLSALQALMAITPQSAVGANEIKTFIQEQFKYTYSVQTIIVVLTRFMKKQVVHRTQLSNPNSRQRFGFYLVQSLESMRNQELIKRFKPIAEEFFNGDLLLASQTIAQLIAEQLQHIASLGFPSPTADNA